MNIPFNHRRKTKDAFHKTRYCCFTRPLKPKKTSEISLKGLPFINSEEKVEVQIERLINYNKPHSKFSLIRMFSKLRTYV